MDKSEVTSGQASDVEKFWLKENVSPEFITQEDVMTTLIPRKQCHVRSYIKTRSLFWN
jgi:hypothetical protein